MPKHSPQDYAEKLKDPRWQKKRLEIFERDGWQCKNCLSKENSLVVHHFFYLPKIDPWDTPNGLLLTLCENCHNRDVQKEIIFGVSRLLNEVLMNKGWQFIDLLSQLHNYALGKRRENG